MRAPLVVLLLALAVACEGRKRPWFCHDRDCPSFETVDKSADFSKRCYDKATWAASCSFDEYMPDGALQARARVLNYIKENDLWGATPFATFVHMGLHNQAAWNATAPAGTSALLADGAGDSTEEFEAALAKAAGPALDSLHKVVCIAYYLPDKYQAVSPASTDLDRRPPRPSKDSRVRLFRTRRWEAYVAGFSGFATPPRFVYESAKLAHTLIWHHESFKWGTAILFEYDSPTKETERWNEVLIPAEPWHSLPMGGEELYAEGEEGQEAGQEEGQVTVQ